MGIIVRQSIKTVISTYIGISIGLATTLWLFPLVLTEEQVGLTRTLINAGILLSTFAAMGVAQVPMRFFPYYKDPLKQHNGFLFFLLASGFIGYSLFAIIFLFFQSSIISVYQTNAPSLIPYLGYLIPFVGIIVFWNILEAYSIFNQLPVVPGFLREVVLRLLLATGLVLLLFHAINFQFYIGSIVGSYCIVLILTVGYLRYKKILFVSPSLNVFSSERFKSIIIFCGFVMAGNIGSAIVANIDGLMLSAYAGLKSAGIYAISFFIATFIEIPKRSLSQVLIPLVSEANKNNDVPKLRELYKKSSINQLIVGGVIFLCLWANIENIFRLIPNGNVYVAGKWVVFYIGLAKLFDMTTGINAEIIGTSRYYKYDLLFYIFLSIVGVAANLLLIPSYGIIGAAIASAVTVLLFNAARYLFILKIYGIQPFSFSTGIVIALGAGALLLNALFPTEGHPLINIAVRSSLIVLLFIGGSILLHVSEDINGIVAKIFFRIKEALKIL